MAANDPAQRTSIARTAAYTSWTNTPNWSERTAAVRRKSPVTFEYWLDKARSDFPDDSHEQSVKRATAAHRAYQQKLGRRSGEARRAKRAKAAGSPEQKKDVA
jgi:hypothetical protein